LRRPGGRPRDGGGVGAVAEAEDGGDHEEGLDAEGFPDPAAEQRDENRDEVVHRDAGRDSGTHLLLAVGDVLDIDVGRHRREGNDGVKHIVHAAHDKGYMHREEMVGEAVEKADDNQNQSVSDHHRLIADLVDQFADERREEEACDRGNREKQADDSRVRLVEEDQNIWTEGEENLLAGAVEHLQHIVLTELLPEVEAALGLVRGAFAAEPEGGGHGKEHEYGSSDEDRLIERSGKRRVCRPAAEGRACYDRKEHNDGDITQKVADLVDGVLIAQGLPALTLVTVFQGQRILHSQLDVLTEGIDENREDYQCLDRRHNSLQGHSDHHYYHAHLVHLLRRETVEDGKEHNQQKTRQLTEKLGDAAVHLVDTNNFGHVVIEDTFIESETNGRK